MPGNEGIDTSPVGAGMVSHGAGRPASPSTYEIRLGTRLEPRWQDWFDGFTITPLPGGHTLLTGPVADQAALHGLLAKIRDLGLPLVSVSQINDRDRRGP